MDAWTHAAATRHTRGFSFLEALLVVMLLGILAALVVPRCVLSAHEARKNVCAQNAARINQLVERWRQEKGSSAKLKLTDIAKHSDYFPDGLPQCPVDGSKYKLHDATHRVIRHQH